MLICRCDSHGNLELNEDGKEEMVDLKAMVIDF